MDQHLAGLLSRQQIVDMNRLTEALRAAVAKSPASRRELCRAAGVEQSLLARVLAGEGRISDHEFLDHRTASLCRVSATCS